ncbi:MAG: hypothetical protein KDB07_05140 [Planctomycetes bacterium]|nr:hypothetical protein [Planctomycetota bacterium]
MVFSSILSAFPSVDPIPVPAPIWLIKALLWLTSAAHFVAVQMVLGGLAIAIFWGLRSRNGHGQVAQQAASQINHRLPITMAMLINLGIPPLLFTQVLYGQALYTSSVLIGAFWIAVVPALTFGYFSLYWSNMRADKSHAWTWVSVIALLCILFVGFIYTNNFTLMLRPEAWQEMYENSPLGLQLNTSDATVWPRYGFMLAAGGVTGGIWLTLLGSKKSLPDATRDLMRKSGASSALVASMVTAGLGVAVWAVQSAEVKEGLAGSTLAMVGAAVFGLGILGCAALAFLIKQRPLESFAPLAWLAALMAA